MNSDIAKMWVDALESGNYKQGRKRLRKRDSFCCLGVLCDLYIKHEKKGSWGDNEFISSNYLSSYFSGSLPTEVQDWSGMKSFVGSLPSSSLVTLNDSGKTFEEIAQVIKENVNDL